MQLKWNPSEGVYSCYLYNYRIILCYISILFVSLQKKEIFVNNDNI